MSKSTAPVAAEIMHPTPAQVLGPYFLPDSPVKKDLTNGAAGDKFQISGQVLSTSGAPLANATVHVWLADPKGVYDNQDKDGNPLNIPVSQHKLRARIVTDKNGKFSFTALRPGNYPVGDGPNDMRPGHVHFKVEAKGHKTLVTQLYFQDDPHNEHDIPGEGFFKPELAVHFQPARPAPNSVQKGAFNFILPTA
jgi:protocatechuate 3,4-dioxygenase beta subunit